VTGRDAPGRSVRVAAPAKLTLALRVLGTRPDGFHELDALCVRASAPADTVTVAPAPPGTGIALALTGPTSAGLPTDATNLAVVAAARAGAVDVAIAVHKEIPAGGGLGGGSADAAAVLLALAALEGREDLDGRPGAGRPSDELVAVAAAVGSDVPVCLLTGLAWMRGRGEVVVPIGPAPDLALVVVTPPFGCSTPAVYRAWDRMGGPVGEAQPAPPALAGHLAELRNDLEPAALEVEPRLADLRAALVELTGRPPLLAGSGASYVVLLDGPGDAAEPAAATAARLAEATGARAWAARFIP
jgi:4-diphosphocytidyl-2-C-methyl-D-erythritol kinase